MFLVRKPSLRAIEDFLSRQQNQAFSYREVGSTNGGALRDYTCDRNQVTLGKGSTVFEQAVASLRTWQMFDLGWVQLFPADAPVKPGTTVAVVIRHFGFWSLNACRVVYVIQEPRRFGFAYGTLQEHAERGEEQFSVEWRDDDSVCYKIVAFSKPNKWQAGVARSLARMLQKRFARDSMAAMLRITAAGP